MFLRLLLLALSALFLFGCSATITSTNLVPPRAGDINAKQVGILEIKGDRNAYFANTLTSVVGKLEKGGEKRFQIFDRAQIENIFKEHNFQATIADPETIVRFGRLSGIQAGFFGGIDYKTGSRNYLVERSKCEKDNCYKYNVPCTDTDHALRTTLSLTDFSTTKVLYSNTFNKSVRVTTCSDSSGASVYSTSGDSSSRGGGLFDAEREVEEVPEAVKHLKYSSDPFVSLVNQTLIDIAKDLGEYHVTSVIEIEKNDDTLSKADQERFKRAVDFATAGRFDRACEAWKELERANLKAPNLIFNLGVCREAVADYEGALTYYKRADALALEPNKMINRALARVNAKIARFGAK